MFHSIHLYWDANLTKPHDRRTVEAIGIIGSKGGVSRLVDSGLDDRIGPAGSQIVVGGDEGIVDLRLLPQTPGCFRRTRPQD